MSTAQLLELMLKFLPADFKDRPYLEYHAKARTLVQELSNVGAQHFTRDEDTPENVLELIDPAVNTIAYIFALIGHISTVWSGNKVPKSIPEQHRPGGSLWNKIARFLEVADPIQLRYVGLQWKTIVEYVEHVARATGSPALAIAPIRSAMFRLDPTTGTFTTTHLRFIRLCMETRCYTAAVPILDNYIHSLPSKIPKAVSTLEYSVPAADVLSSAEYINSQSGHSDTVTAQAVQEYYVLGAGAYIGVRQYKRARDFLEHVLVVPCHNGFASGLMVEAYKKWVILNCLVDFSAKSPPRTMHSSAVKNIRALSKAYDALAEAFLEHGKLAKLRAQINAGKDVWEEDGNTGLVNQLVEHQHRYYISRLSRTYSAIPVARISATLGGTVEEVTHYLATLITEGHLNAQLDHTNKPDLGVVLRFFLDPTQGPLAKTEKQQQQALFEQTQRTNMLAEQVKSADYLLSLAKEHVEYVKRKNKTLAGPFPSENMDVTWEDNEDEDLMGDH